ncbi:unnamed protein product [Paramecium primaurelia]|uniref:Uncharacterized protein n=1 Tax=Paramecium primaurelia TaxID=5886 RepID=A0A8S1MKU5_PARPR|nr:unnamed protein product [Paramecium primaurelia]
MIFKMLVLENIQQRNQIIKQIKSFKIGQQNQRIRRT